MTQSPRVPVNPKILDWAIEHGEKSRSELAQKYPVDAWRNSDSHDNPTFKQLQRFSQDTHIPFNYFFGTEVPREENTFVKFRTVNNASVQPSRRLIDTIHMMESRQAWMKDDLLNQNEHHRFGLLHQVNLKMSPTTVATTVLNLLTLSESLGTSMTDEDFFTLLRTKISALGIMVMQNGIVGTNTHRPLDVTEFRAFVLIDPVVPLIFINSADSKKAKIFSLLHEFIHVLLGQSEVLNVAPDTALQNERWINRVTINVLMPPTAVKASLAPKQPASANLKFLSRRFHTSLVATAIQLKSMHLYDDRLIDWAEKEQATGLKRKTKSTGGDFYNTALSRVDRRFANAVINHEASGQLAITSAASMLGVSLKTYDATVDRILGLA